MLFLIIQIFLSGHVCVCPLKEKLMHIHSCKPTGTKSGHSSFNPMHFVNACVYICVCVFAGWNVTTMLMQLIFSQKEGRGKIKKKKEKIDTAARF